MRNPLGNKANALFLVLGIGSVVVLACGGGDDTSEPANDAGGGDVVTPSDGSPGDGSGATTIDVDGTLLGTFVNTPTGEFGSVDPITSRDLVIVDAAGNVTKTTSGIGGKFHVAGVAVPYDIFITHIAADANDGTSYIYYEDLTRPDPTVVGVSYILPDYTTHMATLTASVASCTPCNLYLSCPSIMDPLVLTGSASSNPYGPVNIRWVGAATDVTMPVHFYAQNTTTGMFVMAGDSPPVTFHDGQNAALGTVTLSAIAANSAVDLSWPSPPAGYEVNRLEVDLYAADQAVLARLVAGPDAGALTTHLPSSASLSARVSASAHTTAGIYTGVAGIVPTNADITIAVSSPPGPTLLTPADHATGIASSDTFTWSAVDPNVLYSFQLNCGGVGVGVATTDTSVSLARLAKAGITLPPATSCYWTVYVNEAGKTVDEYAVPPGPSNALSPVQIAAASVSQTFTTQ